MIVVRVLGVRAQVRQHHVTPVIWVVQVRRRYQPDTRLQHSQIGSMVVKPHSHWYPRFRVRLRQIATLRLWDVASNAENGYGTHSLRLTQIMQKKRIV